mmetsp:Transcript_6892/g.12017  ORF Transcript_6892/g.12017 Transcript_6892/m.12017 type:complete len:215 (+) Transcript_6892:621-1265(+)
MLKTKRWIAMLLRHMIPIRIDTNPIDGVVSLSHQIPCHVLWLSVVARIPRTTPNLPAPQQIRNGNIHCPPYPTPMHTILVRTLLAVDLGQMPMQSLVQTDLDARYHTPTSTIAISRHRVVLANVFGNRQHLVVTRRRDHRVDVELQDNVRWIVPPVSLGTLLGRDLRRQYTVIMIMVVVPSLVWEDIDVPQPLDHPPCYISWNDDAHRKAMIRE